MMILLFLCTSCLRQKSYGATRAPKSQVCLLICRFANLNRTRVTIVVVCVVVIFYRFFPTGVYINQETRSYN